MGKSIKYFYYKFLKLPKLFQFGIYFILFIFGLFFILNFIFPLQINKSYSSIVTDKNGKVIHSFLSSDDKWRMFTELEEITPELQKTLIFKEDKYFYYHFGINPVAICRAFINNVVQGKRTSGASTISMQVARMLQPKKRTYGNKIIEMFRAFQLEWHFSKKEILQLYLNLVPYGGNIEGVKSASILYFDKAPNHLSLAEITALTIIPNRPNSLRMGKKNDLIVKERNKWLERFQKANLFDEQTILDALEEPLGAYRLSAPKKAPHFSYRIKSNFPEHPIIKTNLDLKKQQQIEKLTANHVQGLYARNIKNAAVLVLDNRDNSVVAYVGSADFFNEEDAGQVDGIRAIRSPGSTLKPLLYAMGFDRGIITPKSMISDVPVSYSGYEPENYDEKFNGKISVEFALSNSLNVPAVKVLNDLKTDSLTQKLIDAGFYQIKKDRKKLGLSLVLGGCGVTLEELTRLYSSFANEGKMRKINYVQNNNHANVGFEIISPSSNFMLTEILTNVSRPDLPAQWQNTKDLPKVAWKTGTSYGRKDAWSIGYNKNYTIGVWVGNFSAEGVPDLSGSSVAAPLLFNIFNAIDYRSEEEWFAAPEALDFRLVCTETGNIPNDYCESQAIDYFLPSVSKNEKCNHLKEVFISPDSTKSYCTTCLPESGYKICQFENHPPEMITFYDSHQIPYQKIPTHNSDCERIFSEGAPEITSPLSNVEYFVDVLDSTQIMLTCNAGNDVSKLFWYIDNVFYKSSEANEKLFFTPKKGSSKISCTDDKGRNTDVWVNVKYVNF